MKKLFFKTIRSVISLFLFIAIIIFSSLKIGFFSFIGNEPTKTETLLYLMSLEHRVLHNAMEFEKRSISKELIELFTNVNVTDMKTLLISGVPGLYVMSPKIILAGEGSDFTNLPIESPPPPDFYEEIETEAPKEHVIQTDDFKVLIYHSHTWESFLPLLDGVKDPNQASHREKNITLVGKRLGEKLEEKGIKTLVDTTDIQAILKQNNKEYYQSYEASREQVTKVMKQNDSIQLVFDLHRDSQRKQVTTTTIEGETYAKSIFVIGTGHKNYDKNLQFAKNLESLLQKKYPTLSRGIYEKPKQGGNNGVYNQDLIDKGLLIEIGGVDNTLEELYRTADAMAEIISEYYWSEIEVKEVNK